MVLTIKVGRVGALYLASGTSQALTNEPMQEVDLTAEGRPRYTVYEITSAAKRYIDFATACVFTASTTGILTPYKFEPCGCRIYLTTALGSGETVVCTSGKYIPISMCIGAMNWSVNNTWETDKIMLLRDTAKRTILKQKAWTATADLALASTCAQYTTALAGDDNALVYTHRFGGDVGNNFTIEYTAGAALAISISGYDIIVTFIAATTTAGDILNLWGKNAILNELGITCEHAAGSDGTGVVDTLAHTHLSGGLDAVDYAGVEGIAVAVFYSDYDADARWEGYTKITKSDLKIPADGEDTVSITFDSYGSQYGELCLRKS